MKASAWQTAFVASIFLFGAAALKAQSSGETQTCTNATLTGPYGYLIQGSLVNSEEESLEPYADMGTWTADGNGNISGSGTQSFEGTIEEGTTITGTYTVNANCTGSATLTYGNSIGALGFSFVIVDNGAGLRIVQTTSGFIASGGARQQPTNCVLESLNSSYSFNISGSVIDSEGDIDPYVDSGEITFNGTGGFSVIDTNSFVGTVTSNRSFTGTYTTHSICTGTLTFTDPTLGALIISMAIVDGGQGIRFIDTDSGTILFGTATALGDLEASGNMAQVASGGGWLTTFTLTNTGTTTANIELNFFDDNGDPLSLPLIFLDSGETTTTATLSQTIAAGATLVVATNAKSTAALVEGSAVLTSNGGTAGGFAVFDSPAGQEAVVPLGTGNAAAYILAFDNTNGLTTGVALANVSNQAVKVPLIMRDDTGAQLGTETIGLGAHGHTSFLLATTYEFTKGKRGTVEFDTPANGQISPLGLRATATGGLTTVPVLVK